MDDTTLNRANTCRHVRNICVLAHVDHGKTTLVDCLLASNGIISQRMAGKLRYMDSRLDEQERGITMKCSSISLVYKSENQDEELAAKEPVKPSKYLVNVIDSPGHVDFFGEVSTALRVCDGCIILVDVIEGICSQTRAALQQAWLARVRPILILNKIDRLFIERQLSSLDIYIHLVQTLEQVNAFVGELFASQVLTKLSSSLANSVDVPQEETSSKINFDHNRKHVFYDWSSGLDDADDSGVYFSPENGNVLFASAIDGWGFTIADFATILSKSKLGFSEGVLKKTLWGDFYLNAKEKRIQKGAQTKAKKPLFVSLVLENLSRIYEKFTFKRDKVEMAKIAEMLGIKLSPRDINHTDSRTALIQLFSQWMPLSNALLKAICDVVPCPSEIPEERVERIMCSNDTRHFDSLPAETRALKGAFLACQAASANPTAPLIVCVSKMFAFERALLPQYRQRPMTQEEISQRREKLKEEKQVMLNSTKHETSGETSSFNDETTFNKPVNDENTVFIGFSRVFSGTLRRGDWVFVLGPKHDPSKLTPELVQTIASSTLSLADLRADQHVTRVQVQDLYLLMGRDLKLVEEVHAGHICGIGGLEAHVIKSATLSSTLYCAPFVDHSNAIPILRVAVEPTNPSDMPLLIKALRMLNQADACVDVKIQETGEHVIIATGEVHLERCIVDLVHFLGEEIEFIVSEPIVPFRETIISPPKVDMLNETISDQKSVLTGVNQKFASVLTVSDNNNDKTSVNLAPGLIESLTPNKKVFLHIRARPLPEEVIETLESNQKILLELMQFQRKNVLQNTTTNFLADSMFSLDTRAAMHELRSKLESQFKQAGWPDDTMDKIWSVGPKFSGANLLINRLNDFEHQPCFLSKIGAQNANRMLSDKDLRYQFENSFINGFQLCSQAGPLCDEPMMGVCFEVEQWKYTGDEGSLDSSDPFGPLSGQIMSTVKECCRRAFQAQPQRLMAAMFSCIIQINSDALGKMYAVMGRRHGRILHADLQEGSQMFTVTAVLPVVESFDFANEIRKQTSGKANPQLAFSNWEVIDTDPFWVPTTEEEYMHYGEKADSENRALRYMNAVRRRKGLHVEEKIVEHAEKQRTLTKNNEDSQTEANRLRLLERQRQILETKLQRRQHQTASSGVVASRPATSGSGIRARLSRQASSDVLLDASLAQSDQVSTRDVEERSTCGNSPATAFPRARTSIAANRKLTSLDSSSPVSVSPSSSYSKSPSRNARQNGQMSTSLSGNVSSSPAKKPPASARSNLRDLRSVSRSEANLSAAARIDSLRTKQTGPDLVGPNPLTTILTDEELLNFVSQSISPEVTLQCTIIRDKKGLDRSLYPTYYMHLQDIIINQPGGAVSGESAIGPKANAAGLEGTATISMSESVDSLESIKSNEDDSTTPAKNGQKKTTANTATGHELAQSQNGSSGGKSASGSTASNNSNRKVFILSGRRRKKSKTYVIGNNAFDISRDRCLAKLKSNVLGTQFTAIRLQQNGVRHEIASISYETNVLGFKGPRKMAIIMPKIDEKTNVICNLSLQEEYRRSSRAILLLKNKTPIWNEETQSYVLNFHGRVTQASVKNFQLVVADLSPGRPKTGISEMRRSASSHQLRQRYTGSDSGMDSASNDQLEDDDDDDDDEESDDEKYNAAKNSNQQFASTRPMSKSLSKSGYLSATNSEDAKNMVADPNELVSLQFGRVSNTQFSCDVSWPLSLLQAFAIALSSFDSKLACE